jgi:hypothetical protein
MRQEGQSADAQHRPVGRPRKEIHTADMATREVPPVILPDTGAIERDDEEIVVVDKPMQTDYMKALAFMEEPVTIRIERSRDKFAPAVLDFYVNGKALWVPVGRPVTISRKYVEVIARAQPYDVRTTVVKHEDREENRVERNTINNYPFSVIRDDNPRGSDWLMRVMAES